MSEYLSRTGSVIVILALIVAAVILATQFSFGRLFSAIFAALRRRRRPGRRRRSGSGARSAARRRQRRDVIAKYGKKDAPVVAKAETRKTAKIEKPADSAQGKPSAVAAREKATARDDDTVSRRATAAPPVVQKKPVTRTPDGRRRCRCRSRSASSGGSAPTRCRRCRCSMPPKAERKIDERELMDSARLLEEKCREFSVEGSVVQIHPGPVVTTFEFKPDAGVKYSKVTGLADDLVPGDAGRIGADRSHSRQGHGRHPDSESESRSHLAARAARIRRLHALDVEADPRARQDHSRRAVHGRSRDHAAPADRRLDRHGQVGRPQRDADQHPLSRRRRTMCG